MLQDQDLDTLVWGYCRTAHRLDYFRACPVPQYTYIMSDALGSSAVRSCSGLLYDLSHVIVYSIKLWPVLQQAYKKVYASSFVWTNPLVWDQMLPVLI